MRAWSCKSARPGNCFAGPKIGPKTDPKTDVDRDFGVDAQKCMCTLNFMKIPNSPFKIQPNGCKQKKKQEIPLNAYKVPDFGPFFNPNTGPNQITQTVW